MAHVEASLRVQHGRDRRNGRHGCPPRCHCQSRFVPSGGRGTTARPPGTNVVRVWSWIRIRRPRRTHWMRTSRRRGRHIVACPASARLARCATRGKEGALFRRQGRLVFLGEEGGREVVAGMCARCIALPLPTGELSRWIRRNVFSDASVAQAPACACPYRCLSAAPTRRGPAPLRYKAARYWPCASRNGAQDWLYIAAPWQTEAQPLVVA